jgi:hypothetical protein
MCPADRRHLMGYRDDLRVNKFEVIELLETHTDKFMDWGEKYSDAVLERDETKVEVDIDKAKAKDQLEEVRAHMDLKIRTNYEYFGLKKAPTEKLVDSLITKSPEIISAKQIYYGTMEELGKKLAKAEHNVNVMKIVKEDFEHRKSVLDSLSKLLISGFYSAKLPKALEPEIKEGREKRLDERSRESSQESIRRRRGGNSESRMET